MNRLGVCNGEAVASLLHKMSGEALFEYDGFIINVLLVSERDKRIYADTATVARQMHILAVLEAAIGTGFVSRTWLQGVEAYARNTIACVREKMSLARVKREYGLVSSWLNAEPIPCVRSKTAVAAMLYILGIETWLADDKAAKYVFDWSARLDEGADVARKLNLDLRRLETFIQGEFVGDDIDPQRVGAHEILMIRGCHAIQTAHAELMEVSTNLLRDDRESAAVVSKYCDCVFMKTYWHLVTVCKEVAAVAKTAAGTCRGGAAEQSGQDGTYRLTDSAMTGSPRI